MNRPRRLPKLLYFALSHHYEGRISRTFSIRFRGWEQQFCTRCTAQWASFCSFGCVLWFYSFDPGNLLWAAILAMLPLPAMVDWLTQSWELRDSTTVNRVVTGSALGAGYALELLAIINLDFAKALLGLGVYVGYMLALLALLKIRPFSSDLFG